MGFFKFRIQKNNCFNLNKTTKRLKKKKKLNYLEIVNLI